MLKIPVFYIDELVIWIYILSKWVEYFLFVFYFREKIPRTEGHGYKEVNGDQECASNEDAYASFDKGRFSVYA